MSDSIRRTRELVFECAGFALLVVSVALLWRDNLMLLLLVSAECLIALVFWHDPLDISFFLIVTILGSFAEVVFVRVGIWRYANPSVLGLPLWFPVAFGTTGLIGQRLARTITGVWEQATASRSSR